MKWFNSKEKPKEPAWWESDWNMVKSLYPIGTKFVYFDRILMVVKYDFVGHSIFRPIMVCEYCDNNGKLHEWVFDVRMAELLLQIKDERK